MRYSTIGDLPVPPIERLPTQIIGRLKFVDLMIFLSKSKFLMITINPYNNEKGKRSILKDLRR
jgi:hypothetical protein